MVAGRTEDSVTDISRSRQRTDRPPTITACGSAQAARTSRKAGLVGDTASATERKSACVMGSCLEFVLRSLCERQTRSRAAANVATASPAATALANARPPSEDLPEKFSATLNSRRRAASTPSPAMEAMGQSWRQAAARAHGIRWHEQRLSHCVPLDAAFATSVLLA